MIRFGVAGFPPAFKESKYRKNRFDVLHWLVDLQLDAFELQMTYGPRMTAENCVLFRQMSEATGVRLSVHASYFIVFTSDDPAKILQSEDTLKRTYEAAERLGARTIVLHPGPLYGASGSEPLERFVENTGNCLNSIGRTDIGLFVETAGKVGQLGSVDEILEICTRLDGTFPCIDFGHVHARTLGTLEDPAAVDAIASQLELYLQSRDNLRIHFHYTPIHFGQRGEIQHRAIHDRYPPLAQQSLFGTSTPGEQSRDGLFHPRVEPVAAALARLCVASRMDFTVISETHDSQEEGAAALRDAVICHNLGTRLDAA
ncbi:TIM barrel protein [Rhodopseudomonas palustris]